MLRAQVKMHWVHETYWQPGPQGNDIHKTNVPNLRMRFRYDNHQEEARAWQVPCTWTCITPHTLSWEGTS